MTYTPFNTEHFLTATLPRIHPRPKDAFEAALHSRDLAYAFEGFHFGFLEQYHTDIEMIRAENCESVEYRIFWPTKTVYEVNVEKLRLDRPEIHEKIVHLRSSDAEKFLGRGYLYSCAKSVAGDRVVPYERVNLQDLRKHLAPEEMTAYVVAKERVAGPEIITAAEAEVYGLA
ncbi:hypothetical protein McpSp1_14740 [Methanocorpusculaceae archaeon Sp1]|uniref:Uncharacterized protein n=1 Tax=Methanorbis furvi TaxID=3028299 RepID=A0AAE4SBE7_9EURY|nr:hypothetical protein [Methanocorpusculaceae archaeon Sp1]MDV0441455.1 hypothetical protein [Methanocorpusculaceae archaeon Ag1]